MRKEKPPKVFYAHRKYLPFLLRDFGSRCAYSCQHLQLAGGIGAMDIDHHNPTLKIPERNRYENLFLATRHCNGKKGDKWPTPEQKALGIRFLNPCNEQDYGVHLFEDPETFEIWGSTPAGKWHVRMLDLNAEHLIRERRRRHELRQLALTPAIFAVTGKANEALDGVRALKTQIDEMICPLPQKTKPSSLSQ